MENYTRTERAQYNGYREGVCQSLGITEAQYNYLRRQADKLHQIDEWSGNGTKENLDRFNYSNGAMPVEYTNEQWELDEKTIFAKIATYLTGEKVDIDDYDPEYPEVAPELFIYHQSDPRGCSLYLDTSPIKRDNYTSACAIY